MKNLIKLLIFCIALSGNTYWGQKETPVLDLNKAIELTLENNYGIQVAKTNIDISKNNASTLNSNLLPKVAANAGANYGINNARNEFVTGELQEVSGAENLSYNASIGINYTLFNGMGNVNQFKQFKQQYQLTEIETRASIETILLELFSVYYEAARLKEEMINQQEALSISKQRYSRAKAADEYGIGSSLELLNAEVNMNTDSVTYINKIQQYENSIRNVNLILGADIEENFTPDTSIAFNTTLNLDTIKNQAIKYNVELLRVNKIIEVNELGEKVAVSGWYPTIQLNGNYGYNGAQSEAGFLASQNTYGFNGGVTMSWNIFDGGRTKVNQENAKLQTLQSEVKKEEKIQQLKRDVVNLITSYQNNLYVLEVENKSVNTATLNFTKSKEQFELGQINSTTFREAQLNLLQSKQRYNNAKYQTKLIELRLYQISGLLLNRV